MSIVVSWHEQNPRVMIVTYSDKWIWEDIFQAEQTGANLIDASPYEEVVIIHNMKMFHSLPPNAVVQIKTLIQQLHPGMRLMIFVGMNSFLKSMWDIAKRLAFLTYKGNHEFSFAATNEAALQEARQFLQEQSMFNKNI